MVYFTEEDSQAISIHKYDELLIEAFEYKAYIV